MQCSATIIPIEKRGLVLFFPFTAPTDDVLCAMKLSALLSRQKGRDFYDVMFLLGQAAPDYSFLSLKCGIHYTSELKTAIAEILAKIDLKQKSKDFENLPFTKGNSQGILSFEEFIKQID